jgi:hypothetical protein
VQSGRTVQVVTGLTQSRQRNAHAQAGAADQSVVEVAAGSAGRGAEAAGTDARVLARVPSATAHGPFYDDTADGRGGGAAASRLRSANVGALFAVNARCALGQRAPIDMVTRAVVSPTAIASRGAPDVRLDTLRCLDAVPDRVRRRREHEPVSEHERLAPRAIVGNVRRCAAGANVFADGVRDLPEEIALADGARRTTVRRTAVRRATLRATVRRTAVRRATLRATVRRATVRRALARLYRAARARPEPTRREHANQGNQRAAHAGHEPFGWKRAIFP